MNSTLAKNVPHCKSAAFLRCGNVVEPCLKARTRRGPTLLVANSFTTKEEVLAHVECTPQRIAEMSPSFSELTEHWRLDRLPPGIIRCTRIARQYVSVAEAEVILAALNAALPVENRNRYSILLDARATPAPATDPGIDAIIVRYRKLLFERFAAAAILVKTAAGTMQVWRQAKQDGVTYRVFNREDAALDYLTEALQPQTSSP